MTCSERVSQWNQTVSRAFPHLSRPQARLLAWWSLGMLVTECCGLTQISVLLALLMQDTEGNVRQRLREWLYDACDKQGAKRKQLEVQRCFAPLLGWIVRLWPGEHRLALGLDATVLGHRFTVLCISVLVGSCAIPVAWKVLSYNQKGSWQPSWLQLLHSLEGQVPGDWQVLILADRGLYALWLYQQIVDMGWHPFLRINVAAKARREGEESFEWISKWLPPRGEQWSERVECFVQKKTRLQCTLLMWQAQGYEAPWVIVTDLPPGQAQASWYRMRCWMEGGFKDLKRGGWGWHHTKMHDVKRVERLWLAMAVSMVWALALGSHAEQARPAPQRERLPATHVAQRTARQEQAPERTRDLSWFKRGRLALGAAVFTDDPWDMPKLSAAPWPTRVSPPRPVSERCQGRRQRLHRREQQKRKRRKLKRRQQAKRAVASKNLPV